MTKAATIEAEWTEAELLALRPPPRITVTEWAERNLVVTTGANRGPFSADVLPYLREPMDAFSDPDVESVTMIFAAQSGKTMALLAAAGYAIDVDFGDMMVVLPKPENAEALRKTRFEPMIDASDSLRTYKTNRPKEFTKARMMQLRHGNVHFCGAGSPSDLASHAIRWLFMDEVGKYPRWSGREASPIALATERTITFPDRKIGKFTTPVLEDGPGWTDYIDTDQRRYWVPCPHCGEFQTLEFENLKWPERPADTSHREHGVTVRREGSAWYECGQCGERIDDDRGRNLRWMIDRGTWAPKGATVSADGEVRGAPPPVEDRGYQLSGLYSPFRGWSRVAAEFLRAQGDGSELQNFTNQWLGLPFSDAVDANELDDVAKLVDLGRGRGVVPLADVVLTAGIDVGGPQDGPWRFEYVVRAWGPRMRSWLVDQGTVTGTIEDALGVIFRTYQDPLAGAHRVEFALIDEGYLTPKVRDWVRPHAPSVYTSRGLESATVPIRLQSVEGLEVHLLDTNYLKDRLAGLMSNPSDHPSRWTIFDGVDPLYLEHLTWEHKVPKRKGAGTLARSRGRELATIWVPQVGVGSPHWWDAEVYAMAAAMRMGLHQMSDELADDALVLPSSPGPGGAEDDAGGGWTGDADGYWEDGGPDGWL